MRRSTILFALAAGISALAPFTAAFAGPLEVGPVAPIAEVSNDRSPQYISSDPVNGAQLHEAPEVVKVAFTEPLDAASELKVFACGKRVDDGKTVVSLNQLEVRLDSGPQGIYQARWVAKGLAGLTGSSDGFIEFSVSHTKASCASGHGSSHGPGGGEHVSSGEGGAGQGGASHGGSHGSESTAGSSHSTVSGHRGTSSMTTSQTAGGHPSGLGGRSDQAEGSTKGSEDGSGGDETTVTPANPALAASSSGSTSIPAPEAGAILLALAVCIALGVSGGWLARLA